MTTDTHDTALTPNSPALLRKTDLILARIHSLLCSHPNPIPHSLRIHYSAGEQWNAWRHLPSLAMGSALEVHIALAYDWLAHNCNDTLWRLFAHAQGACSMVMQTSERVDDPGLRSDIQASLKHLRATLASVSLGN